MGSATPKSPARAPSTARYITVWPSRRNASARAASAVESAASAPSKRRLPSATRRPLASPVTPCPVTDWKLSTRAGVTPRSAAPASTAAASGCSLPCSSPAASASTSSSEKPAAATTATRRGLPSVSVPVLSTTTVSTFSMTSSASALLIRTPAWAPRPVATMMETGVARPSAHGHAMISTATAFTRA